VADQRFLIVNADDFGLSGGVNAGVIEAHERGIVTSASLMVRRPAAREAADYGRDDRDLSLGLHIDLGEWTLRDGEWMPVYEVVPRHDQDAVAGEVGKQLGAFRQLVGRDPTHLDSHQHVHDADPSATIMRALADHLGIPLRNHGNRVRFCGDLYGRAATGESMPHMISVENLFDILRGLQPGITELGCHPGKGNDVDSDYSEEREVEVEVLCDPRVRETIASEGIVLCNFADIAGV
jgi:predicted glycoside hydrolase/deacetylase ChbG (UPF0249 family)